MAEHRLTATDDGSSIRVKQGDEIAITLPENPTTGFRWAVESQSGDAVTPGAGSFQPGDRGVGAGGSRVMRFTAAAPGTATIRLRRARAWESEESAAQLFTATIIVEGE